MTEDPRRAWLAGLEERAAGVRLEDRYLWPRTPDGHDHQEVIRRRVGASDYEVGDPRSRSGRIVGLLRRLRAGGAVPGAFSLLDIACGDAVVLWEAKKAFPEADCLGVDCKKGDFGTHAAAAAAGVVLYRGFLQELFREDPPAPFDVALMLNTYRGWESADLRAGERDLPALADAWFRRNARRTVVTATGDQVRRLRRAGFAVEDLGPGEDRSRLVCLDPAGRRPGLASILDRLGAALGARGPGARC